MDAVVGVQRYLRVPDRPILASIAVVLATLAIGLVGIWNGFLGTSLIIVLLGLGYLFQNIARLGERITLLTLAYIPFAVAINLSGTTSFTSIRLVVVLSVLICFVDVIIRARGRFLFPKISYALPIVLLLGGQLIAIATAVDKQRSLLDVTYYITALALYFQTVIFIRSRQALFKAVEIIAYTGTAIASIGIIQFLIQFVIGTEATIGLWRMYVVPLFHSLNETPAWNPALPVLFADKILPLQGEIRLRATGIMGSPHFLSYEMAIAAPCILALALLRGRQKKRLLVLIPMLAINLLAELLTFSRAGYVGLMVGTSVVLFFAKRRKLILLVFALGILSLFLWGGVVVNRLSTTFDLSESSNVTRLSAWRTSLEAIRQNPLLGGGRVATESGEFYNAHNNYLQIWIEGGLISLIGFLWLFGAAFRDLSFVHRRATRREYSLLAVCLLASLAWIATHNVFDIITWSNKLFAQLAMVFGLITALRRRSMSDDEA